MEGLSERIPRAVLVQTFCGSWGSRCTFPLDTKQIKSQSADSSSAFSARVGASPIRLELLLLDFPAAPAAAAWLHCISSHTKNHRGANGEYEGINPDGKLFTVGIVATTSRESSGLVSRLRRHRGNALRTGLAFAADWISKCDGRSPVNRWPPLLSCVGCLVECVAAAFWYFIFQRRCCNRMLPTPICFTWSAHHHGQNRVWNRSRQISR